MLCLLTHLHAQLGCNGRLHHLCRYSIGGDNLFDASTSRAGKRQLSVAPIRGWPGVFLALVVAAAAAQIATLRATGVDCTCPTLPQTAQTVITSTAKVGSTIMQAKVTRKKGKEKSRLPLQRWASEGRLLRGES